MAETWSPRCPKCGGRGNAEVVPPPEKVLAGRLRPDATHPYTLGSRVRCTRCNRWFPIGAGTEWRPNPPGARAVVAEPLPEDDEAGSATGPHEPQEDVGEGGGDGRHG